MYVNYKRWSGEWNEEKGTFSLSYDGVGTVARNIQLETVVPLVGRALAPGDYERQARRGEREIAVCFVDPKNRQRELTARLQLTEEDAQLVLEGDGSADIVWCGELPLGEGGERLAVRLDGRDDVLRAAVGEAALRACDTVYAPEQDAAVTLRTLGEASLRYDREAEDYAFSYHTRGRDYSKSLRFQLRERVYRDGFDLDYRPLGPAGRRPSPVGWMSWYAVGFRAGEETILANADAQKERLARYGADTIWVDWEWCHRDHGGQERPGTDMFHPDPGAYPHGLGYLAEEIARRGFVPALWMGPTCDCTKNELIALHPDLTMREQPFWSGRYFLDPSHPAFLEQVLPRMIAQIQAWGYRAVKWDVMPDTARICDEEHERLFDPTLSTRQIMKNAYARARALLGEQTYMLYCSGSGQREEDMAVGCFDAMRVGGDIFGWEEFVRGCVDRVYDTYFLHRVAILCDPDNVIVREEFNTLDQARTRASMVSLLGLPFTLGDELTSLPEERMNVLRRCIPPLPARPVELRRLRRESAQGLLHVRVEKAFLAYDLADFYNLGPEETVYRFDPAVELQAEGPLHAYDYWRDEYLGVLDGPTALALRPYESRVLALHLVQDRPQLLSASRHVSQGAQELTALAWQEEECRLTGVSTLPGGEEYAVVVAAPEGYAPRGAAEPLAHGVWRVRFRPETDGELAWEIPFEKTI